MAATESAERLRTSAARSEEQGQELASNLQERASESGTASEAAGQTY